MTTAFADTQAQLAAADWSAIAADLDAFGCAVTPRLLTPAQCRDLADLYDRPEVLESIRSQFGQRMEAADIADAITYIVTRPRHVAINEMLIRPTEQER